MIYYRTQAEVQRREHRRQGQSRSEGQPQLGLRAPQPAVQVPHRHIQSRPRQVQQVRSKHILGDDI